jgi:hypothetical protein
MRTARRWGKHIENAPVVIREEAKTSWRCASLDWNGTSGNSSEEQLAVGLLYMLPVLILPNETKVLVFVYEMDICLDIHPHHRGTFFRTCQFLYLFSYLIAWNRRIARWTADSSSCPRSLARSISYTILFIIQHLFDIQIEELGVVAVIQVGQEVSIIVALIILFWATTLAILSGMSLVVQPKSSRY